MCVARKPDILAKIIWFGRNSDREEQYKVNKNISSHNSHSAGRQATNSRSGKNALRSQELPLETSLRRHRQTPKNFSYIPEHKRKILDPPRNQFARARLEVRDKPKSRLIPVVPNSDSLPLWLIRWQTFQRYSSIAALLLAVANLMVYGWTVYAQQLWTQNSQKLQELQRQERQITTTNEVIKNKMAKEAEKPTAGLVAPTPAQTVFVPPASNDRKQTSKEIPSNIEEIPQQNPTPIGY